MNRLVDTRPLSNTPVRFRRRRRRGILDQFGETIVDGRRALVRERYVRGDHDYLEQATTFAELTQTELRVCLPTWSGFGTMRFAWLFPRRIRPTRSLVSFVDAHEFAADAMRRLVDGLSPVDAFDDEDLQEVFWEPLVTTLLRSLPRSVRLDEVNVMIRQAERLLAWYGVETSARRYS